MGEGVGGTTTVYLIFRRPVLSALSKDYIYS